MFIRLEQALVKAFCNSNTKFLALKFWYVIYKEIISCLLV